MSGKKIVSSNLPIESKSGYSQYISKYDVIFILTKPKSKSLDKVKAIMKMTSDYFGFDEQNKNYFACYNISEKNINAIQSLYQLIYGWKSVFMFVEGREILYVNRNTEWLHCYFDSFLSNDPDYCIDYTNDPIWDMTWEKRQKDKLIKSPCKRCLQRTFFDSRSPKSYKSQFNDQAINLGYISCPRFKMNSFEDKTKHAGK